jgi:hypothetical protein
MKRPLPSLSRFFASKPAEHKVSVVINFCTIDKDYIKHTAEQSLVFSSDVIISYCDKFFNGDDEDFATINQLKQEIKGVKWVEFKFEEQWLKNSHDAHNRGREIGLEHCATNSDYIFFIDADEVPEGKAFKNWLETYPYYRFNSFRFQCYWYFMSPEYQATTFEEAGVLVRKSVLSKKIFYQYDERRSMITRTPLPVKSNVPGLNGMPMVHHYSWARTRQGMLNKVGSWGHRHDRDWAALVNDLFDNGFKGSDFVHRYQYKTVKPPFDIILLD